MNIQVGKTYIDWAGSRIKIVYDLGEDAPRLRFNYVGVNLDEPRVPPKAYDAGGYCPVLPTPSLIKEAPTPHPHAELMMKYAKDAMETDEPWRRWSCRNRGSKEWTSMRIGSPSWLEDWGYKRLPQSTIEEEGL